MLSWFLTTMDKAITACRFVITAHYVCTCSCIIYTTCVIHICVPYTVYLTVYTYVYYMINSDDHSLDKGMHCNVSKLFVCTTIVYVSVGHNTHIRG